MSQSTLIHGSTDRTSGYEKRLAVRVDTSGRVATTAVPTQLTLETRAVTTNASTTTPQQITGTDTWFVQAIISGKRDQTTANSGIVYLGSSSTDAENMMEVYPGTPLFLSAPAGHALNLADFYFDVATANDGLAITLLKPAATSS